MEAKLGRDNAQRIPPAKLSEGSKIAREFEAVKRSFNGTLMEHYLTIPREAGVYDNTENGIEDGGLLMTQ